MAREKRSAKLDRTDKVYACSGGPRDRAWYSRSFWLQARAAAVLNGETPTYGRTLGYVETDGTAVNPSNHEIVGTVLRWNPELAARSAKAATT